MSKGSKKRNVLALTYWSFKDALVQSAVLPYLRMIRRHLPEGSRIFLVTLEQAHLRMTDDELRQVREQLDAEGVTLVAFGYTRFGAKALAKWLLFIPRLLWLALRERISVIHAWCTPAGGAGYILSRLTGAPLILDSYEPHAESMVELGAWPRGGVAHRILFLLEKLQSRRARAAIATTRGVETYAREKFGASFPSFYVKPASVDLNLFSPARAKDPELLKQFGLEGKLVCVYAGKIGGIYLEREIFDFFKAASDYWGERFRVLLLTNADEARVSELAQASGLNPAVITTKFVPFKDVPRHMALGDFAINPVRPIPTKRYCTSVKDGEYWATGLPVVITPDIGDDSNIVREHRIGAVLEGFDRAAYDMAVAEIDALLTNGSRAELTKKIRAVADSLRNVRNAEKIYAEIYGDDVK